MFRFILDSMKLLILMIFITSCSEETIIYDEIENKDSTIQTSTLPQTNSKLFQTYPQLSARDKLFFGSIKESEKTLSFSVVIENRPRSNPVLKESSV